MWLRCSSEVIWIILWCTCQISDMSCLQQKAVARKTSVWAATRSNFDGISKVFAKRHWCPGASWILWHVCMCLCVLIQLWFNELTHPYWTQESNKREWNFLKSDITKHYHQTEGMDMCTYHLIMPWFKWLMQIGTANTRG